MSSGESSETEENEQMSSGTCSESDSSDDSEVNSPYEDHLLGSELQDYLASVESVYGRLLIGVA